MDTWLGNNQRWKKYAQCSVWISWEFECTLGQYLGKKGLVVGPYVFCSKLAGKSLNDVSHHKRHKNVHCHSCNRQRRVVVHLGWRVTPRQNNGKHLRNLMHVADQNTLTFRSRTYILKSLRVLLQKDTHGTWTWWLFKLTTIHGFGFHVFMFDVASQFWWFSMYNKRNMCLKHRNISIYEF